MTPGEALSPSLIGGDQEGVEAFELKFKVSPAQAEDALAWARRELAPDPYGDPALAGAYRISTLYLDTPALDVYHRSPTWRSRKYRLRRYGDSETIFVERKSRSNDRVRKRRSPVPECDVALLVKPQIDSTWTADWFRQQIQLRRLRPTLQVEYQRNAFIGSESEGPVRLTLDRSLRCRPVRSWEVHPTAEGMTPVTDALVLEMKYRGGMPALFKRMVLQLRLDVRGPSKYRRGVEVCGLAGSREVP